MIDPISNALLSSAANVSSNAAPSKTAAPAGANFAETLKAAAGASVNAIRESEATSMQAMQGGANMQEVVRATIAAELAIESAVAVRNKMIESYQEIMRMPI